MFYHFIVSKIRRKLHFLISQNLTAGKWIEETKKEKKKIYQRQKRRTILMAATYWKWAN